MLKAGGRTGLLLVLLVPVSSVACGAGQRTDSGDTGTSASVSRILPAESPDSQMARFLGLAVATHAPAPGRYDSTYFSYSHDGGSDAYWQDNVRALWLADSRVLDVQVTGDSAIATVQLTTVADQRLIPRAVGDSLARWDAVVRVEEDTARWVLHRTMGPLKGTWMVRGDALDGYSVLQTGRLEDITWRPAGGSAQRALALVDSVRSARGLPAVR